MRKLLFGLIFFTTAGVIVLTAFVLFKNYCRKSVIARGLSSYSPIIDATKIDKSYLLIAPMTVIPNASQSGGIVYLTDLFGKPLHTWAIPTKPFYAELDTSAHLIVLHATSWPGDINPGEIQKFDWNGKLIWDYKNGAIHHDFTLLPNGNIATIASEPLSQDLIQKIKGGKPVQPPQDNGMKSDQIIELNQDGKIVWSWHQSEHLDPAIDEIDAINDRKEWTHTNSIQYIRSNPFDGEEGFLMSMRQLSSVIMIRKRDGAVIWRSPKGMLGSQHDATLLPNGHVLVFNNWTNGFASQVIEIDPKTNQTVWDFWNGKSPFTRARFHSPIIGGVQRLSNGNTMVIDGLNGHLFEVTPQKKLVWDFVNPFTSPKGYDDELWQANAVFKARRYKENEIHWPEKLPPSLPTAVLQCQSFFNIY